MIVDEAYLTSVPVYPFTLYIIVVVCNPYLGVIVLSLFFCYILYLHEQRMLL